MDRCERKPQFSHQALEKENRITLFAFDPRVHPKEVRSIR